MNDTWTKNGNLPPGYDDKDLNKTVSGKPKELFNEGTMRMEHNKLWDKMSDSDKKFILKYDNKD